ncbi:transcription termination/antitermination protein NusA [bacterium]|nr:transcription termination/antitermination protein NusA [bacterium]
MDFANLKAYVNAVAKEKDLDPAVIKEAIEYALISASKKNLSQFRDARANLDMETGTLSLLVIKEVVEEIENDRTEITRREARKVLDDKSIEVGDEVDVPIDPSAFGRIAAQSARQIVMQRIRDAERQKIQEEYSQRIGQVVTGTVQRFERRDVILNIGRAEGILPIYEQPMGSHYKFNDRLKLLIQDVRETPKGPMIVLSRKSPNLVVKLFEQEVPEIADSTVKIIGVAREAGVRTKIAVVSTSSDVDPVGACVGMKGSRVQMVVRELDNEKIDIVPYSMDATRFVTSALNPAKIVNIHLNEKEKRAEVMVARGNLAIAIGRKGQNSKLAARLTGWRLDIRSEEEEGLSFDEIQTRYLEDFLLQIQGLSNFAREALLRSNYNSVQRIARATPQDLLAFTNDEQELAETLVQGAKEYMEALDEIQTERKRRGLAPGFFIPSEFEEAMQAAAEAAGESGEEPSEESESGEISETGAPEEEDALEDAEEEPGEESELDEISETEAPEGEGAEEEPSQS